MIETRGGSRASTTVVVVGGKGAMGRSLVRWFSSDGFQVRVLERDDWDSAESLCAGADLVVLSVPIELTVEVARRVAPVLGKGTVLADVTSVKTVPLGGGLVLRAGHRRGRGRG